MMDKAVENAVAEISDESGQCEGVSHLTHLLTLSLPHSRHQVCMLCDLCAPLSVAMGVITV